MSWIVEVAPETDDRLGHGEEARCGIQVSEDRARYTRAHEGLGLGEWLEQGSQPYQAEIELHICAPSAH
eukprot:SAG11_NODE_36_length_21869_cov_38.038999_4_plen_69_part_00